MDLRRPVSFDSISVWVRCCCEFASQETELILAGGHIADAGKKYPVGKHTVEFSQLVPTGPPTLRLGSGKEELNIVWTVVVTARKEAIAEGELEEYTDVMIATMCFDNGVTWPIPRDNLIDRESIVEIKGKQLSLSLATDRVFEYNLDDPLKSLKVQVIITNETGKNIESIKLKVLQLVHVHIGEEVRSQNTSGATTPTASDSRALSVGQVQLAQLLNRKSSATKKLKGGIGRFTKSLHITSPHTISKGRGKKYRNDFQLSERILNSSAESVACTMVVHPQPSDFHENQNLAVSRVAYAQKMFQIRSPANSAYESPVTSPHLSPRSSQTQTPFKFPPSSSTPPQPPATSRTAATTVVSPRTSPRTSPRASPRILSPSSSERALHSPQIQSPLSERSASVHLGAAIPNMDVAPGAEPGSERRETVGSLASLDSTEGVARSSNTQAHTDFGQISSPSSTPQRNSGNLSAGVRPVLGVNLYVPGSEPQPMPPKPVIPDPVDNEAELLKERIAEERTRIPHICPSFTYNSSSAQISVAYVIVGQIHVAGTTLKVKLPLDFSCAWL